MARCECTVVVEYEETVVTVEPGDMTVTVEPEGPQGPQGSPGNEYVSKSCENSGSSEIEAGTPVRRSGSGVVAADKYHPAIGVASQTAEPGYSLKVLLSGFLTITEWGLMAGNVYYLGDGVISATPASGEGEYVQRLGSAMSTDTLAVNIEQPVRL